jgi:cytochrome c553
MAAAIARQVRQVFVGISWLHFMRFSHAALSLFLALTAGTAAGQSLVDGDTDAGKTKAAPCTACHGADGMGLSPLWPNLAGQGAPYIVAQLHAFKEGTRSNPLMSAQAMPLSDEDMRDLAVYFETMAPMPQPVANADLIDRGAALWRGGKKDDGVAACMACHGPTGSGMPASAYPALAGQHAAYVAKQLRDYASGERQSDGKERVMRDIAARLTSDDIDAVASYIQGLKQ